VRENYLAILVLLEGHLAFWVVHRQSAYMCSKFRQATALHAAHSQHSASNCISVPVRDISSSHVHIGEEQLGVRRVRSDRGLLRATYRLRDPSRNDDGDHPLPRSWVLREIGGC